MIYLGKIDLDDYKFVYDPTTESAWFKLNAQGEIFELELKTNGDKKDVMDSFRLFSPTNQTFKFEDLVDNIVYITNKNRLGYKMSKKEVIQPMYGMQPYAELTITPPIKMSDFERVLSSTKTVNAKVKKGGDIDQFTF